MHRSSIKQRDVEHQRPLFRNSVISGTVLRERVNQGRSQSHARNSVCALATIVCAASDALRMGIATSLGSTYEALRSKIMICSLVIVMSE